MHDRFCIQVQQVPVCIMCYCQSSIIDCHLKCVRSLQQLTQLCFVMGDVWPAFHQ
jgi:hypothetical protein